MVDSSIAVAGSCVSLSAFNKVSSDCGAVYQKIREEFPKISLGTVYRNLNLLADSGEILRLNCGDGVEHFDATTTPHNHFICRRCRKVIDLEADWDFELDTKMDDEFPGKIEGHEIYFYGICKKCL